MWRCRLLDLMRRICRKEKPYLRKYVSVYFKCRFCENFMTTGDCVLRFIEL